MKTLLTLLAFALAGAFGCTAIAQTGSTIAQTASAAAQPSQPILLWANGAPGAKGTAASDQPAITVYLPGQNPTRTGIVVCPGGGYSILATDWEGTKVAAWLNARGVAAYVLRYRLGPRYHYPVELMDAQRAIRTRADSDGLDPDRIGIWGFSAGGHLASTTGTHFDDGNPVSPDPIERASSRPDFMVLAYPVISMEPGITHAPSLHNLLGDQPSPMLVNELSNETQVTPRTPPTFLFSTTADKTVPVMNSILFYEALLRAGVPVEMHIFQVGNHGSGLGQKVPELRLWPVLLQNWLHLHGWMATAAE